jgi:hypothetical protein
VPIRKLNISMVTSRQPIDFQINRSEKSGEFTFEAVFTDGN